MAFSSRTLPSHLRQASTTSGNLSSSTGQSPILLARINEKKAELENLKQLRDLSAGLAGQMQMLEEKLATLSDGTEGKESQLRTSPWLANFLFSCRNGPRQLEQRSPCDQYGFK